MCFYYSENSFKLADPPGGSCGSQTTLWELPDYNINSGVKMP